MYCSHFKIPAQAFSSVDQHHRFPNIIHVCITQEQSVFSLTLPSLFIASDSEKEHETGITPFSCVYR